MHRWFLAFLLVSVAAAQDAAGCKDHPAVSRFAGAVLTHCNSVNYDEFRIFVAPPAGQPAGKKFMETIEGKVTSLNYFSAEGATALEVMANYKQALTSAGYKVSFECGAEACRGVLGSDANRKTPFHIATYTTDQRRYLIARKAGTTIAVETGRRGGNNKQVLIYVDLIEAKQMQTGQVVVNAASIDDAIGRDGRIALYGIYFDTAKAEIKPESKPQLDEIAKVLASKPALSVYVVGHTDNQGTLAANQDLSKRRADAVVSALAGAYKIPAARMTALGAGPMAPVSTNANDQGRALNRRVEIVAR